MHPDTGPGWDDVIAALGSSGRASSDFDLNQDDARQIATYRPAAVLMPLVERSGGINLLLTKRSSHLKHHPGQIAFPGGKVDETDASPAAAALREAHEEIALSPEHATLLGQMPHHKTVTAFEVHPFVARIDPRFDPVPEPGEVAEVFEVPLAHVTNPANYLVEGRRWRGHKRHYYVVPYGPYYIWGATARMLRMLADRLEQAGAG